MHSAIKGSIAASLFLLYPYLVYLGIERGIAWLAPAFFSAIYLWQAFTARTMQARMNRALIAIAFLLGAYYLQSLTAKVMPVLIQLMLVYFFGRTLLKGRGPPLIERFVLLEFPQSPPSIIVYCHQLTIVWALFFAFNAVVCSALAIWGDVYWWALFNGMIVYLLIGVLMVGEYIYRHYRFPDLVIHDPRASIKTMIVNGRKVWQDH